jgi:hypothetical protein
MEQLIKDYGLELVQMKIQESNTHKGYSREELQNIISLYGTINK